MFTYNGITTEAIGLPTAWTMKDRATANFTGFGDTNEHVFDVSSFIKVDSVGSNDGVIFGLNETTGDYTSISTDSFWTGYLEISILK